MKLEIGGQRVDLGDAANDIAIKYASESVLANSITRKADVSGVSIQFKLPDTPRNRQVFGPLADLQVDWQRLPDTHERISQARLPVGRAKAAPGEQVTARLESADGLVLVQGLAKLNKYTKGEGYAVELRGQAVKLKDTLQNLSLRELTGWQPDPAYLTFNGTLVDSLRGTPTGWPRIAEPYTENASNTDRFWPGLVDYGNLTRLFDGGTIERVAVEDMRLGTFIRPLIFEMFRVAGLTLDSDALDFAIGSSNFRNLCLLFTQERWLTYLPEQNEPNDLLTITANSDIDTGVQTVAVGVNAPNDGFFAGVAGYAIHSLGDTVSQTSDTGYDWYDSQTGTFAYEMIFGGFTNITSSFLRIDGNGTYSVTYTVEIEGDEDEFRLDPAITAYEPRFQAVLHSDDSGDVDSAAVSAGNFVRILHENKTATTVSQAGTTRRIRLSGSFEFTVEGDIDLTAQPQVRFLVLVRPNTNDYPNLGSLTIKQGTEIVVQRRNAQVTPGARFWPIAMLPEITCWQLLENVLQAFNLYLEVDKQSGKASLLPYASYFEGYPTALALPARMGLVPENEQWPDWTGKMLFDGYEVETANQILPRRLEYTYSEAEDVLNTDYQNRTGSVFGEYSLETELESKAEKAGVELDFEPLSFRFLDGSLPDADYDTIASEIDGVRAVVLRETLDSELQKDDAGDVFTTYDWGLRWGLARYASKILPEDLKLGAPDGSLDGNLGSTPPEYTFGGLRFDNDELFKDFHEAAYTARRNGVLLVASFWLNANDVASINFRRPIIIRNQLYRLLEITQYFPGGKQPAKCKLLKL